MIRPATKADTPRVIEMVTRFLLTTRYGDLIVPQPARIAKLVDLVLQHGIILVAEIEDAATGCDVYICGMIALTDLPHLLTGEPYADEQAWWVEPEHRGGTVGPRLMQAAEAWARENGLTMLKMVAPEGSDVGKFYTKRGYQAIETVYVKAL